MIRFSLPMIGATALLAACTQQGAIGEANPPAPVPGVGCNAAKVKKIIGQQRSDAIEAEAKRLTHAKTVRWITPGSGVTMDFRSERLNLSLNEAGKIISGHCG